MSKQSVYFSLPDISESHDAKELKKGIDHLMGILSVSVNTRTKKVAVDFDNTGTSGGEIENRIRELGYEAHLLDKNNLEEH